MSSLFSACLWIHLKYNGSNGICSTLFQIYSFSKCCYNAFRAVVCTLTLSRRVKFLSAIQRIYVNKTMIEVKNSVKYMCIFFLSFSLIFLSNCFCVTSLSFTIRIICNHYWIIVNENISQLSCDLFEMKITQGINQYTNHK